MFYIFQQPLLKDPRNPEKFASVLVPREGYRKMLGRAEKAKDPARKLMNDVIDLLLTRDELARSGGMGDREKKGKTARLLK